MTKAQKETYRQLTKNYTTEELWDSYRLNNMDFAAATARPVKSSKLINHVSWRLSIIYSELQRRGEVLR